MEPKPELHIQVILVGCFGKFVESVAEEEVIEIDIAVYCISLGLDSRLSDKAEILAGVGRCVYNSIDISGFFAAVDINIAVGVALIIYHTNVEPFGGVYFVKDSVVIGTRVNGFRGICYNKIIGSYGCLLNAYLSAISLKADFTECSSEMSVFM